MHETHLRIANLSLHIWFLYDLVVSAISIVSCSAIQMKVWFQELPSVNSLFIFPRGYTRLKYWSSRQGHVVFLVPNEIQVKARPRHDLLETNVVSLDGQYEGQYDQYEENRRMC